MERFWNISIKEIRENRLPMLAYVKVTFIYHLFFVFIYLFWLHRVLVAARGIFVVACGLLVAACRLLSCGMCAGSSSPTRDWTWAPALGQQSLAHWTTREVPHLSSLNILIQEMREISGKKSMKKEKQWNKWKLVWHQR